MSSLGTAVIQLSVRANAGKKFLIIGSFIPAYAHILRIFFILQLYFILILFFSVLIVYFCIHFSPLWLIVLLIIVRYYPLTFFEITSLSYTHILYIFYILQWYSILIKFFSILIFYFYVRLSPLSLIIIVCYYQLAFFIVTSRFCRMFLEVPIVMIEYIIYTQYIQFVAVLDDNCLVYWIVVVLIIFLFLLLCTLINVRT